MVEDAPRRATKKPKRLKLRFRSITIFCTDVAQSVRFYEGVLGAVRQPTDYAVGDRFRLGGLELSLV